MKSHLLASASQENVGVKSYICKSISSSIANEEDKKKHNGLYEMGLTGPYSWADKGRAQLVQRSIMDRHCEKHRWNPNINRIWPKEDSRTYAH